MSGTEERLFILFEARSSGRGATKVGAGPGRFGTLCAEVQTRQLFAVLFWPFLEVLAKRKIEKGALWSMRDWRRHVQERNTIS